MIQTFTVPEHDEEIFTENLQLDLQQKICIVNIGTRPVGSLDAPKREQKPVDVPVVLAAELTVDEIAAFKKGIKAIVAYGWGKTIAEITGEVF